MKIFRKIAAVLTAAVIAVTSMTVSAFAVGTRGTIGSAQSINSGETITKNVSAGTENSYSYYKLITSEKGSLIIDVDVKTKGDDIKNDLPVRISIYDEDGNEVPAEDYSTTVGSVCENWGILFDTNTVVGKTKGTVKFLVSKGTYYLKYEYGYCYSSGKINVTVTFPSDTEAAKINYITINMERGDTLSLGADMTGTGEVTWKSSKPKVAVISETGKVTAKSKGTTVISAKCGKTTKKIKIKVS